MITQIYAVKTVADVQLCIDAGLDRWGLEVGRNGTMPNERSYAQTRELFAATPAPYPKMALSIETDLDVLTELVESTGPDLLHLCGDIRRLTPASVNALRDRIPGVEIIQAIPMTGPESLEIAHAYAEVAHALLLDSVAPNVVGIGIAGVTHDWALSRQVVAEVGVPCILAGGLSPENVAEAIRAVRPWAVDSNTHTCIPGTWDKDFERMRQFVLAAKAAAEE